MPARQYNFIYTQLVGEEPADLTQPQNVLGLLAYGIYKQEKIKHIKSFKERNGREPEEEELNSFHLDSADRLSQYTALASHQLETFVDTIFKSNISEYQAAAKRGEKEALQELIKAHNTEISNKLNKLSPTKLQIFGDWIMSGIVGNIAFIIVIALLVLCTHTWLADYVGMLIKNLLAG